MKLQVKTIDMKTFTLNIDESKTIGEVKVELSHISEIDINPENQRLIYAGKVLTDEINLESLSIEENKFLVVMGTTNKPTTSVKEAKPTLGQQKSDQTQTSTKRIESMETAIDFPPLQTAPNADLIQEIVDMGYPEPEARIALETSYNNPSRAIQYLIEGLPPINQLPRQSLQQSVQQNLPVPPPPTREAFPSSSPLHFLQNNPQFDNIRRLIQQNPEIIPDVIAEIGQTNPQLLSLILENQDEVLVMLNQPPIDDDNGSSDKLEQTVELTEEDRSAVNRLTSLGFPEDLVIQVYFACDRNEEQSVDILFSQMESDTL